MRKALSVAAIGAFGVAVASLPAAAADLKMPVKAPAVVAVDPGWTGFYIGGNIGYSWGDADTTQADITSGTNTRRLFRNPGVAVPGAAGEASGAAIGAPQLGTFPQVTTLSSAAGTAGSSSVDGIIGGAQIGYNWQRERLVFGLEADIQASGQKGDFLICSIGGCPTGSTIGQASHSLKWFGTVRGRFGGLITPGVLLYATGGLAYGEIDSDYISGIVGTSPIFGSNSTTRVGWTAGAGVEGKVTPNWTVKVEYLYMDFGSFSHNLGSGASNTSITVTSAGLPNSQAVFQDTLVASTAASVNTKFHDHIVRVGFNRLFNNNR